MHISENVLTWLEMMDRQGLAMPLAEMGQLLEEAPEAACSTEEYHYLRGLYDGRFLNEELRRFHVVNELETDGAVNKRLGPLDLVQ